VSHLIFATPTCSQITCLAEEYTYFPERESAPCPRPLWCPALTAFQIHASSFYFSSSPHSIFITTYLRCREHFQAGDLVIVFRSFLETIYYIFLMSECISAVIIPYAQHFMTPSYLTSNVMQIAVISMNVSFTPRLNHR
jgi:hypothetical protein